MPISKDVQQRAQVDRLDRARDRLSLMLTTTELKAAEASPPYPAVAAPTTGVCCYSQPPQPLQAIAGAMER